MTDTTVTACPVVFNSTIESPKFFLLASSWLSWNWIYSEHGGLFHIKKDCPTSFHSVTMSTAGGVMAHGIQNSIFNMKETLDIYDCRGLLLYKVSTGHFLIKILNANGIYVSFTLEDNAGNILGYIKSKHYFNLAHEHKITNMNGEIVAVAESSFFHSTLKIKLVKPSDPGADLRALVIAFSQKMLSSGNHSDMCNFVVVNTYFLAAFVISLAIIWLLLTLKIYCGAKLIKVGNYFSIGGRVVQRGLCRSTATSNV